jgi:two-component system, OmpR family, response regulator
MRARRLPKVDRVRVLVIDDDDGLREGVTASLRASGFGADGAASVAAARALLASHRYDCLVLDRMLPGGDGLRLLDERPAAAPAPPVLVLTARDSIRDRVEGFEHGADDYLVKPFAMAELIARVRTLCRRQASIAAPLLRADDVELDTARRQVRRGGVLLSLTTKEYAVLELLLRRAGTAVTRAELVEHCWDELTVPMSNALDVVISQLRRKLGEPPLIATVRSVGYRVDA